MKAVAARQCQSRQDSQDCWLRRRFALWFRSHLLFASALAIDQHNDTPIVSADPTRPVIVL